MKIAVIGTGYVGLVTSTCFAESGNEVVGIDSDPRKIQTLQEGRLPIYEPGLLELVQRNIRENRLAFTGELKKGIDGARVIFVAVGTPASAEGASDLRSLWAVADALASLLEPNQIVVLKSTVPVGTTRRFADRLAGTARVASNPEFLKEGVAVDDFMKPDRVVVGTDKSDVAEVLRELYAPFLRTEKPFLVMSPESAELTKYVANAMLATKISFINEMANLCEPLGADINDVRRGIGHDSRIGFQFLFPGVGFGGSCFPKDLAALVNTARDAGAPAEVVEAALRVNRNQKQVMSHKLRKHYGLQLQEKRLAVWGLAFKPRTDDIREAPALHLIDEILKEGAQMHVHDPEALANVRSIYAERLTYCEKPYDALKDAHGLVVMTEWQEFRHPDFEVMRRLMREHVIFDGRNIYDPETVRGHGFKYYGIGRGS